MSRRERLYRRLLLLYPQGFRAGHAEAIVGTLLDGARERGVWAESRELAGLLAGVVRARGEEGMRSGRGKWRHGFALLLVPLAVVNLAIVGAASWSLEQQASPGSGLQSLGGWWILTLLAAVGLVASVGLRRRFPALTFAMAGVVPLAYDEWLQASGRGIGDHFSMAHTAGFQGPLMSPFLLFTAGVTVICVLAWSPRARDWTGLWRAVWCFTAALAVGVLIPTSLYVLLALALVAMPVCLMAGVWDRRLYGVGLALWLIALPYVFWWWATELEEMQLWSTYLMYAYVLFLPALGVCASVARRRRRQLAG